MAGLSLFAEKSYPRKKGRGRRLQPFSHNAMKTEFETATTDLARRVPPHSVEAERAVLAGLILRPSAMGQIAPMLHPEDFYLPAHQTLYAAALGLHTDNRPVDLVTLAEHLRDQGSLEQAGGAAYIADLAQSHVSAANAEYYAKLVRDKSIQRGLIEAGAKIVSTGFDTSKDLAGLIDEAEQSVMAVSSRTSSGGFRPVQALVGDVVDAVLKPAEGGITGLATGYPELDAITRGLQPSDHHRGAPCDGQTRPRPQPRHACRHQRRRARGHFLAGNVRTPACPAYDQPVGKDSAGAAFHRPPQQSRGSTLLRNRRSAPDRAAVHQLNARHQHS